VDVENPVATYETPYGYIVRNTNGDENPGQRWIDLNGKSKGNNYGLTVINDAKYGYSVERNDMRISVIRSAVYAHHNPRVLDMNAEHLWMDQGIHTFKMWLVPYSGNWTGNNIVRMTEEFMTPSFTIYQGIHRGSMPRSGSLVTVDQSNILVASVKQAENNDDLIFRCVETSGKQTKATLDLRFAKMTWSGQFRPLEIKTIRMNLKSGTIKEVNLLEE
jgi:alpha-mannosidase